MSFSHGDNSVPDCVPSRSSGKTPAELLAALKALGFAVTLDGVNIRIKYLGVGNPPAEAGALIENLRQRKADAVAYLSAIDDGAVPYVAEDYFCPRCGKHLEVFYPVGQPYDGPCWGCLKH